jgi:hypothetical protein
MWFTYAMVYYSVLKNENVIFLKKLMELEIIILCVGARVWSSKNQAGNYLKAHLLANSTLLLLMSPYIAFCFPAVISHSNFSFLLSDAVNHPFALSFAIDPPGLKGSTYSIKVPQ